MEIEFLVKDSRDAAGIAKLQLNDMEKLEVSFGSIVEIEGRRITSAYLQENFAEDLTSGSIELDPYTRENANVKIDEKVKVRKADTKTAEKIILRPIEDFSIIPAKEFDITKFSKDDLRLIGENKSMSEGDVVPFQNGKEIVEFVVVETTPKGIVILLESTQVEISKSNNRNPDISLEHEKNVLGKFKQAEAEFLLQVEQGIVGCSKYEKKYSFDYPKTFDALSELTNELKRFEEETANLRKILRKDPNDAHARYDLALRLHALGRYYDAEDEFIRALRLAPSSAALHASYGNLLAEDRLGYTHPFAEKEYIEAVRLAPDNIEYGLLLVNFYLKVEPSYKAIETLQEIIKLKPNDARAYKLMGDLLSGVSPYIHRKDYAEALNLYHRCLELEPNDIGVHYSIGQVYCKLRRFKEAKEEFEKYKMHGPEGVNVEEYIFWEREQMEIESKDNCLSCDIAAGKC